MGTISMVIRLCLILILSIGVSCSKELDFKGFFIGGTNVDERFGQSMSFNSIRGETEIIVKDSNYTFFAAGDVHVGSTGNFDLFLTTADTAECLFFVLAGDLTTGNEDDYSVFKDHLSANATVPFFLTAGNHDLYFDGWKHFYKLFGASVYSFTVKTHYGSDLFICLDTGSGTLGNKQLKWLTNFLKEKRQMVNHCIVITHINFFRARKTSSTNLLVEEVSYLINLFAETNVDMVIMGHDHSHAVEIFGNTIYLTMDALEDGHKNPSYLSVTCEGNNLNYRFVEF